MSLPGKSGITKGNNDGQANEPEIAEAIRVRQTNALLANWPTAEEVTADPERLNNLTGQVESIERRINQRKAESQDDPVIE